MAGGYGTGWGLVPWGGSTPEEEGSGSSLFASPLYQVPAGSRFGRAAISKFTGEPISGPLSGASGLIFFSPALFDPSSENVVEFASISVSAIASDSYLRPSERSSRVFRFGGGPGFASSNPSRTNAALYRSQPTEYTAVATIVQTTPPGPTTFVRIP
jgi:hypothetical protein